MGQQNGLNPLPFQTQTKNYCLKAVNLKGEPANIFCQPPQINFKYTCSAAYVKQWGCMCDDVQEAFAIQTSNLAPEVERQYTRGSECCGRGWLPRASVAGGDPAPTHPSPCAWNHCLQSRPSAGLC